MTGASKAESARIIPPVLPRLAPMWRLPPRVAAYAKYKTMIFHGVDGVQVKRMIASIGHHPELRAGTIGPHHQACCRAALGAKAQCGAGSSAEARQGRTNAMSAHTTRFLRRWPRQQIEPVQEIGQSAVTIICSGPRCVRQPRGGRENAPGGVSGVVARRFCDELPR